MSKTENIILIVLVVIVIGGLIFSLSSFFTAPVTKTTSVKVETNQPIVASKYPTRVSESLVAIDLTPQEYKDGKLNVKLGVNTHTGDLADYDLMQLTTLEVEGKLIKPSSATKLSSHHVTGTLTFEIDKEPQNFKIIITGIPEISERVFEW